MDSKSPYFYVENEQNISSIKELINLHKKKDYGPPGILYEANFEKSKDNFIDYPNYIHHETCGLFRGQPSDWPLIPKSYRDIEKSNKSITNDVEKRYLYRIRNFQLLKFSEMASKQNIGFPKSSIEQMCLAQHYGINTPLLDWTTNIFVAAYFAIDLKEEDELEKKNLEPFIYHIKDERLLGSNIEKIKEIALVDFTALVNASPLDRRIERQFSVFSFHPHPKLTPKKVPITKYRISEDLFIELWEILEGIGFSSSNLFPDYSGIVDRIKKGYMI